MWTQYRRMFWFTQAVIALITFAVLNATHYLLPAALVFFAAMQISAVFGALWTARLKRKLAGPSTSHYEVR